jgi:hypothetical protein
MVLISNAVLLTNMPNIYTDCILSEMKKMLFHKIFYLLTASLVIVVMAELCLIMFSYLLPIITCGITDIFRFTENVIQLHFQRGSKIRIDCLCFRDVMMQATCL